MDIRGHYEILGHTPSLKAVPSDCMRKIFFVFENNILQYTGI